MNFDVVLFSPGGRFLPYVLLALFSGFSLTAVRFRCLGLISLGLISHRKPKPFSFVEAAALGQQNYISDEATSSPPPVEKQSPSPPLPQEDQFVETKAAFVERALNGADAGSASADLGSLPAPWRAISEKATWSSWKERPDLFGNKSVSDIESTFPGKSNGIMRRSLIVKFHQFSLKSCTEKELLPTSHNTRPPHALGSVQSVFSSNSSTFGGQWLVQRGENPESEENVLPSQRSALSRETLVMCSLSLSRAIKDVTATLVSVDLRI